MALSYRTSIGEGPARDRPITADIQDWLPHRTAIDFRTTAHRVHIWAPSRSACVERGDADDPHVGECPHRASTS
jgi:hypothetical protein